MSPAELWAFLPWGYLVTVLIETPILMAFLSPRHPWRRRLLAGLWLTACTYPVVVLVLPLLIPEPGTALAVAEVFAPVAECVLFGLAFGGKDGWGTQAMVRDMAVIVAANLASFLLGEVLHAWGWL